jgi:hypothetical protein
LAAHVVSSLPPDSPEFDLVLAIPDALSEYAQQRLLDALARAGQRQVRFLWNPVALALAWIEALGPSPAIGADGDSLLVLNIGPGAVDSTVLRLRKEVANGREYVVPVRAGGQLITTRDGFDLAASRLSYAADTWSIPLDLQAQWHALGRPETWMLHTHLPEREPFPWYRDGRWELFPDQLLKETLVPEVPTQPPVDLERLLIDSGSPERNSQESETWGELLTKLIDDALEGDAGELRGAVVAGAGFGSGSSRWNRIVKDLLPELDGPVDERPPRPDEIWAVGDAADVVARGACLFGQRVQQGLPTYFDTLPEFEVYAATDAGGSWEPLVRQTEIAGGGIYQDSISGEFALAMNEDELEAYLRLHDGSRAPIKRTRFFFPRAPSRQMPLDVRVEVRPAGGLAVVEMVPEDRGFLGGVQVYLDYDEMEEVDSVPEVALSYPPTRAPHEADPTDEILFESYLKSAIDDFLRCRFGTSDYERTLKRLQGRLSSATLRDAPGGRGKVQVRIVDVNGVASTRRSRELVERLREKLGEGFNQALADRRSSKSRAIRERLLVAGAWLFGAVPEPVHDYVVQELTKRAVRRNVINAAGRILQSEDEFRVFFRAMEKAAEPREREERWFTIDWLWSAKRLLSSHDIAAQSLEHDVVAQIYRYLFDDLQSWIEGRRVNGFGATLNLLFYLFRYRAVERNFLSPSSTADADVRQALVDAVDQASRRLKGRSTFLFGGRRETALEVLAGLKDFLDFRGSMKIIEKLSEFDEGRTS